MPCLGKWSASHSGSFCVYLVKIRCIVFMLRKLGIIPYILYGILHSNALLIIYFCMHSQCERTIAKLSGYHVILCNWTKRLHTFQWQSFLNLLKRLLGEWTLPGIVSALSHCWLWSIWLSMSYTCTYKHATTHNVSLESVIKKLLCAFMRGVCCSLVG